MVSYWSILAVIIGLIIVVGLPIYLFLRLKQVASRIFMPLLAGGIGFFVMQIIIRIPILSFVQMTDWYNGLNIYVLAILLGGTAALFETIARIVTMKLFIKDDTRFSAGIAHGIGHGGIEAILLVGVTFITNLVFMIMINTGALDSMIESLGASGEALLDTKAILIDTKPFMFLIGAYERVATIFIHISLSVITIYSLKKRKPIYLLYVFFVHTLVDTLVVLLSHWLVDASGKLIYIELYVTIVAIILVYIMTKIYKDYKRMAKMEVQND